MEVGVHVEVPGAHVLLDDELVLLHVAPGDHQVVLGTGEIIIQLCSELLK